MHVSDEVKSDILLEKILALPSTVRKQLLDRVQLAVLTDSAANEKDRDLVLWSDAVYQHFIAAEQGSFAVGAGPLAFRKLLAPSVAWTPIWSFMQAAKLDQLPVVERQGVYQMLAEILVLHVKEICEHTGAALSPKMVANCCHLVRGAFDNSFPGYLEAGLVKVVVAQMRRK
jgi:hypothetical protein